MRPKFDVKTELNNLKSAVRKEIARLDKISYSLFAGNKKTAIFNAFHNLDLLIAKVKGWECAQNWSSEYRFNRSDYFRNAGDLCREQFKPSSYDTKDKMLDFKLRRWVEEFSYTRQGPVDDDFDNEEKERARTYTEPAHWEELPSLRESLNDSESLLQYVSIWANKNQALISVEQSFGIKDNNQPSPSGCSIC